MDVDLCANFARHPQYVRLILLPQNKVEVSQVLELKPASQQNTKLPEKSNLT